MAQPTWREIARVKVPGRPETLWTGALDFVTPTKLYRIAVEPQSAAAAGGASLQDQRWTPLSGQACTADGDPTLSRSEALVIDGCPAGALIGKIGGSTADSKPDSDKCILFSVGRHCVFSISEPTRAGALYLGINDARVAISGVAGQLEVRIDEAL